MEERKHEKIAALDDIVYKYANGVFVEPSFDQSKSFDCRGLLKYCKEKGVKPEDLSDEELKRFEITD